MALINCSECGKQVSNKALNCPNCGNPICNTSSGQQSPTLTNKENLLSCPKCNSTNLSTNKKGFSGGNAFTGAILTGGIGLLAGTIGSGKIIITCLKCGFKCKAGEYDKEKMEFKRKEQQRLKNLEDYKMNIELIATGKKTLLSLVLPSIIIGIILLISTILLFTFDEVFFGYICLVGILIMMVFIISNIYDVQQKKKSIKV